jgi:hypothetical protein
LAQAINLNLESDGGDVDLDGLLGERITSAIGYKVIKFIQFPTVPQTPQYSVGPFQIDGLGNANLL